mmetsp:Transcript_29299/g.75528  ORF Transcript_29299/g.75528 Transcript_29299/m.75528 type:complete len:222 (+) Transcript_29299:288-953(+)
MIRIRRQTRKPFHLPHTREWICLELLEPKHSDLGRPVDLKPAAQKCRVVSHEEHTAYVRRSAQLTARHVHSHVTYIPAAGEDAIDDISKWRAAPPGLQLALAHSVCRTCTGSRLAEHNEQACRRDGARQMPRLNLIKVCGRLLVHEAAVHIRLAQPLPLPEKPCVAHAQDAALARAASRHSLLAVKEVRFAAVDTDRRVDAQPRLKLASTSLLHTNVDHPR